MKKALSFALCLVMLFTAIPFQLSAGAEGENPLKSVTLPKERTLFFDDYHENDSKELTLKITGENSSEPVTDIKSIEWRSTDKDVASVTRNDEDHKIAVVTAQGLGSNVNIIATVETNDGQKFNAMCSVTVRESIRVRYESFKAFMNKLPSDVDDTNPVKYSSAALTQLDNFFTEVKSFFNSSESDKTYLERKDEILNFVSKMDDTEENCQRISSWETQLINVLASLNNSRLALKSDEAFWAQWNSAYALMPADISAYTDDTAKAVTDIVNEYENTEWLDNTSSQEKINELAQALKKAIANLKLHTTQFKFTESVIYKDYGASAFKIKYESNGYDTIKWYSSDDRIAYVDQGGRVTISSAIPKGYSKEIRIFAVSNGITASCQLIIRNPIVRIEVPSGLAVLMGETKKLTVDIHGADDSCPVTDTPVFEYVCSDEKIATIDKNGVVHPVKTGKCTITVSVKGDKTVPKVTCNITVSPAQKVTSIAPTKTPTQITVGEVAQARVFVYPTTATNKKIKWTSSDKSVVTVEGLFTDELSYAYANLKGIKSGKAVITYATTDGSNVKGSFTVTVNPLVKVITFDQRSIVTYIGNTEKIKITATCQPVNAGNQKLSWLSSDERVATVIDGKITLKATGSCTITAVAQDGSGVSKSASLLVLGSAESIKMSNSPSKMNTGEKLDLDCTVVTKQGISYSVQDWSVNDEKLAKVSKDGVVTALRPGKVKVTAKYFDGTSASKTITIIAPLKGISLPSSLTIAAGKTKTVSPIYTPEYASNKDVKWTTSDSSVASISTNGVLTAAGPGTAIISVKSKDGGYEATCKVHVIQPVSGVSLNKSKYTLTIGVKGSVKLSATVSPAKATTKSVSWKSSNTKVATVSSSGIVTAKGPGTATITCTTTDGGYKATCKITVRQPVKGIKFSSSKITCYVGQKKSLSVVFTPSNASNKGVTYKISDKTLGTISEKGVLTAKKKGTCTITAVSDDGKHKATCTLKVVAKVDVQKVNITKSSVTVTKGKTKQLNISFTPDNASVKDVKWTSSDKSIATVNSKGVVTGKKGGTVTIKCQSLDTGVYDKCKVTVYEHVEAITLSATSATVVAGKTKILTAEVSPATASDQSVKWSSSNKEVATVSSSGKITALKGGSCKIVARSKDNSSVYAVCKLTVLQPPTKITLSETDIEITRGDKAVLVATVKPKDCFDSTLKWKSSNSSVAKVDSKGVITGVTAGKAVITCSSTVDPSIKRTCNVTVFQPVTGVKLSAEKLTLTTGRTKTLIATVLPSKASNKKVTFKTSDRDVVKVSSKGVIEAVGPGKATVTVRTEDGFYTAKCVVTVVEPVVSVKLDYSSTSIALGKTKVLTATVSPKNATNKEVSWRSSNPLVARVTQSGVVTALAEGTAVITCTTADGGYKASCTVKCIVPVDAVTLKPAELTLKKGASKTLKETVYPEYATVQDVTWTSSDTSIATVDKNGKVTAKKKGVCIITCTTKQGKKKASCLVTVK
ncbi:MAG: Ig domain-containing protein [Acutalibacteraceae bacterium]